VLLGFSVEPDTEANALAREKAVEIRTYRIIYELLDDLKKIMSGEIAPEEKEGCPLRPMHTSRS